MNSLFAVVLLPYDKWTGFSIWGMRLHAHASTHTQNIKDVQKKACLVSFKKLQVVWQIAHLKQQCFLSFTFYITQRSYEKIICIFYFIGSVMKIALYFYFLYINKKKHKWWNNHFSDILTYRLNLKNSSLFFLIQDNFMFFFKKNVMAPFYYG